MHGTEERPSNLAASSLASPSSTTLSLPTRRGTLNPSALIEFAISRMCAGSDLRSLSERTKAALRAKKAAGARLGNPTNLWIAGSLGRLAHLQPPDDVA